MFTLTLRRPVLCPPPALPPLAPTDSACKKKTGAVPVCLPSLAGLIATSFQKLSVSQSKNFLFVFDFLLLPLLLLPQLVIIISRQSVSQLFYCSIGSSLLQAFLPLHSKVFPFPFLPSFAYIAGRSSRQ